MTARQRRWLAGVPALAALVAGTATVTWLYAGPASSRSGWYADAADAAVDAHDERTAAVCYARLLAQQPESPELAMNLARSLDAIGQVDAARSLLLRLAPVDQPGGYLPAHLRLVRQLLAGDHPTAANLDDAGRHLAPVLKAQPADPETGFWVAVLFADRGRWDLVPTAAKQAGPLADVLAPRLAAIAKAQGNAAEADRWSHAAGG